MSGERFPTVAERAARVSPRPSPAAAKRVELGTDDGNEAIDVNVNGGQDGGITERERGGSVPQTRGGGGQTYSEGDHFRTAEIVRLLKNHGVHMMDDTGPHNLVERLHHVLFHLDKGGGAGGRKPRQTSPEESQEDFSVDESGRAGEGYSESPRAGSTEMSLSEQAASLGVRGRRDRALLADARRRAARVSGRR